MYAYGFHFKKPSHVRFLFNKYVFIWILVLKICICIVFVCTWDLQIRCPYKYYNLTIPAWGPILNDTCTVTEKSPYKYGFPYRYCDAPMRMIILRVWVLTYIQAYYIFEVLYSYAIRQYTLHDIFLHVIRFK